MESIGDATDFVKELVACAVKRCHLVAEADQLAVWGFRDAAHSALGVSDDAIGLGLGQAPGLVGALVRRDQDRRDLLPDPSGLGGSIATGGRRSVHVREFAVSSMALLELSEPLIDDRAVVPLPVIGKRGGSSGQRARSASPKRWRPAEMPDPACVALRTD